MSIPVSRFLVPDGPPAVPAGFEVAMQPLLRGLPAELRLTADVTLFVFAPTGDAHLWRDADASLVVSAGDEELAPTGTSSPMRVTSRPPLRIVVERGGVFVGAVPLVVGVRRRVPDAGGTGAIEIVVLDYRIHAGTMRQAGDFGSFVRFAWHRADLAVDEYQLPPLPPRVAERFAGQVQSDVGAEPAGG